MSSPLSADHMYRMGLMSLLASDCGVDSQRCIRMALVHDIAEAIVGDITPHCNVTDEDKYKLEADAVQQIKQMLGPQTHAGRLGVAFEDMWTLRTMSSALACCSCLPGTAEYDLLSCPVSTGSSACCSSQSVTACRLHSLSMCSSCMYSNCCCEQLTSCRTNVLSWPLVCCCSQ